jgi:hypothetical protein
MLALRDRFTLCLAVLMCIGLALPVRSDETSEAGRQIISKLQNAIVTVQLVTSTTMSFGGEEDQKSEDKIECTGTVIDPSGLVVISLSITSPEETFSRMMPSGMKDMKVSSQITDLKIIMPNGQMVPSTIVLRDKDLDLAFLRPNQKPATPFESVDLTKQAKPGLLDQVALLYRMGVVGNRALSASIDRIQCVIEKPRLLYVPGMSSVGMNVGAPVFAMDGSIIGILTLRATPSSTSGSGPDMICVVLPASDVAEAAKQAQ